MVEKKGEEGMLTARSCSYCDFHLSGTKMAMEKVKEERKKGMDVKKTITVLQIPGDVQTR